MDRGQSIYAILVSEYNRVLSIEAGDSISQLAKVVQKLIKEVAYLNVKIMELEKRK
jgi:hypothetical protein